MNFLVSLFGVLGVVVPLAVGVWLGVLGEWKLLGICVVLYLFFPDKLIVGVSMLFKGAFGKFCVFGLYAIVLFVLVSFFPLRVVFPLLLFAWGLSMQVASCALACVPTDLRSDSLILAEKYGKVFVAQAVWATLLFLAFMPIF